MQCYDSFFHCRGLVLRVLLQSVSKQNLNSVFGFSVVWVCWCAHTIPENSILPERNQKHFELVGIENKQQESVLEYLKRNIECDQE